VLALLVQKVGGGARSCAAPQGFRGGGDAQLTRFTGTKVLALLVQKSAAELVAALRLKGVGELEEEEVLNLLALLVQKYKY
jgi:hypothetical protein